MSSSRVEQISQLVLPQVKEEVPPDEKCPAFKLHAEAGDGELSVLLRAQYTRAEWNALEEAVANVGEFSKEVESRPLSEWVPVDMSCALPPGIREVSFRMSRTPNDKGQLCFLMEAHVMGVDAVMLRDALFLARNVPAYSILHWNNIILTETEDIRFIYGTVGSFEDQLDDMVAVGSRFYDEDSGKYYCSVVDHPYKGIPKRKGFNRIEGCSFYFCTYPMSGGCVLKFCVERDMTPSQNSSQQPTMVPLQSLLFYRFLLTYVAGQLVVDPSRKLAFDESRRMIRHVLRTTTRIPDWTPILATDNVQVFGNSSGGNGVSVGIKAPLVSVGSTMKELLSLLLSNLGSWLGRYGMKVSRTSDSVNRTIYFVEFPPEVTGLAVPVWAKFALHHEELSDQNHLIAFTSLKESPADVDIPGQRVEFEPSAIFLQSLSDVQTLANFVLVLNLKSIPLAEEKKTQKASLSTTHEWLKLLAKKCDQWFGGLSSAAGSLRVQGNQQVVSVEQTESVMKMMNQQKLLIEALMRKMQAQGEEIIALRGLLDDETERSITHRCDDSGEAPPLKKSRRNPANDAMSSTSAVE